MRWHKASTVHLQWYSGTSTTVQQSQLQAVLQWTLDLIGLNREWLLLLRQAPSAWLFSSPAARTVSCFEIKKHVIHSPKPKETIAPFNAPSEFECVDFNWWFQFTSWPMATSRSQSRLCDSLYNGNSWQMRGLCRLQRKNVFPACTCTQYSLFFPTKSHLQTEKRKKDQK